MRWRSSSSQPQQGESSEEPSHLPETVHASSSADNDDSDQNFSAVPTSSQIQSPDDNSTSRYQDDDDDDDGDDDMICSSNTMEADHCNPDQEASDVIKNGMKNISLHHSQSQAPPPSSTPSLPLSLDPTDSIAAPMNPPLQFSTSGLTPPPDPNGRSNNPITTASQDSGVDTTTSQISEQQEDLHDGQDHAIPEVLPDPLHAVTWQPQTQSSTCEFTHTITNYSSKRESGCKKAEYSSTTVDPFGNRWRLIVYVNGNGRASNHHLSLFLQVADAEELPFGWKKAVSYVLTLEHPSGSNLGYAKRNPDKTFKLCPKAIDWGWSQFITSDRIQQEGYISEDSLTVRASVTVKSSSVHIDENDSELYLKCAVEEGDPLAVEACLNRGASINCQFKDDLYTPLHTACSSTSSTGSLEVLKILLKRGADGNACNKWRETPLLIAANNGHKAAVKALLDHDADPSLCSEAGWSALTFAAHKGYDEIVTLLLSAGAPVNCRVIEDLSTPLHKACAGAKEGHLSAVKQLLKGNADVHALNKWRETPLLTAANHGQATAVHALLEAGADPCKCTDTGWSPLSIAAYKGHDDVVRLLLEQGAPTEEADPTLSALLQAATKGLPNTVELLLSHGADHTVTTKKGDTALSILVEQNLIDAAVEMVTEYKASVPRCSKDRKKVQRARLLINLRVKQQKEGLLNESLDSQDDSDHDESDVCSTRALHVVDNGSNSVAPAATKKKKKSRASAEAQAKAAEEALLLELEEEDAKAQKDEAAATTKRNKKKKKRERERQQRLQEERIRREKEEELNKQREQQRLLKEEKERKEREARAKVEKEKMMREAAERAAIKRKEKEERDRKKQEHEKRERERISQSEKKNATILKESQTKVSQAKASLSSSLAKEKSSKTPSAKVRIEPKVRKSSNSSSKPKSNSRGWETQSNTKELRAETPPTDSNFSHVTTENIMGNSTDQATSVEDQLENMANGVMGFLGFDSTPNSNYDGLQQNSPREDSGQYAQQMKSGGPKAMSFETPEVGILREAKLNELFLRCSHARTDAGHPLASIDDKTIKSVIYKWILRASDHSQEFFDPCIPSWTDFEMLSAFFQRQLISEVRRKCGNLAGSLAINIEILRDAGQYLANQSTSLAKEVSDFKKGHSSHYGIDLTDTTLGMTITEFVKDNSAAVVIDWSGNKVVLPITIFTKLRKLYRGSPEKLLSSLFALMKRYGTLRMLIPEAEMDYRLSPSTLSALSTEMQVTIELLSDPISVFGNNLFCGYFPDVDANFGGMSSFLHASSRVESILCEQGGSVVIFPPCDSTIASSYVRKIVDCLERMEAKNIPLSFSLFLYMQCFQDLSAPPSISDLSGLDSRLPNQIFVRHAETFHGGQHCYHCGEIEGSQVISESGSLFVLLQNSVGARTYPMNVRNVSASMTLHPYPDRSSSSTVAPVAFHSIMQENLNSSLPSSPGGNNINGTLGSNYGDFGIGGGPLVVNGFVNNSGARRRGRLFDLVDDGDDDHNNEQDEMVSGMLSSLNMSMFQDDPNPSQDVDIEAISLMGIRNPSSSLNHDGRF